MLSFSTTEIVTLISCVETLDKIQQFDGNLRTDAMVHNLQQVVNAKINGIAADLSIPADQLKTLPVSPFEED